MGAPISKDRTTLKLFNFLIKEGEGKILDKLNKT